MKFSRRNNNKGSMEKSVEFFKLQDCDVCCGRGKGFLNHLGNKKFQLAIRANLARYMGASRKNEESQVVHSIVKGLMDSGVRFVRKESKNTELWYDIGIVQAHEKTVHAIRDHILNKGKRRQSKGCISESKPVKQSRKKQRSQGITTSVSSRSITQCSRTLDQRENDSCWQSSTSSSQINTSTTLLSRARGVFVDPNHLYESKDALFHYIDAVLGEASTPSHDSDFDSTRSRCLQGIAQEFSNDDIYSTPLSVPSSTSAHPLSTDEFIEICTLFSDDDEEMPQPEMVESRDGVISSTIVPLDWL